MDSVSGVGVLDKAVRILESVEVAPRTLAGLVEATGFSRATAHRLATALEAHHLLRRDADGRFVLGTRLAVLGGAAAAAFPLAELARSHLERLRDETGESVQLYVRDGDARRCVASLDSPSELRTIVAVGARLPLERGSAGRVLQGEMPGGAGWVESVEEREPGVASVSAPVVVDGEVVAAVGISGPVGRTSREPGRRYGDAVAAAAAGIAQHAG